MVKYLMSIVPFHIALATFGQNSITTPHWIRINQLGYVPASGKVAVWASAETTTIDTFWLVNSATAQPVFMAPAGKNFGAYGPF